MTTSLFPILPRMAGTALTACLAGLSVPAGEQDCVSIDDDALRLRCYDRQFRPAPNAASTPPTTSNTPAASNAAAAVAPTAPPQEQRGTDRETLLAMRSELQANKGRSLVESWDLDPAHARGTFEIKAYKPMHLLVGTHTDHVNRQPASGQDDNSVGAPLSVKPTEVQFQISFKSKVWDGLFDDRANLWFGYTQSSRWQVYNRKVSRPFRETNYEPEVILAFRTPYGIGDWRGQLTSISVNHQSNGRGRPLSRSWNRVILQTGLETDDATLLIRPWWRLPESDQDDDNPHIEDYIGRAELIYARRFGGHVVSLQGRHSLRGGDKSRGSVRVDWSIPMSGFLKAHLSLFSGYGESLIDYNHRQTMIGAGISLVEWR